jgi:hypothetical protein
MGLDLWFRQDVARILAATRETMQATAEGTRRGTVTRFEAQLARSYEQGFEDALRAVGVAFGLAGSGSGIRRVSERVADMCSDEYGLPPLTGGMAGLE